MVIDAHKKLQHNYTHSMNMQGLDLKFIEKCLLTDKLV